MFAQHQSVLRRALIADAVLSGASGLLMIMAAGSFEARLAVPQGLLRYAGASLLPFAAIVAYVATREPLSRGGVWTVVALNAAWVAASVLLLVSGSIEPNGLGVAFILVQAIAVAAVADVQYFGLRKAFISA